MKTIYQKTKQIGIKYLAPAALAIAGGCGDDNSSYEDSHLPVDAETRYSLSINKTGASQDPSNFTDLHHEDLDKREGDISKEKLRRHLSISREDFNLSIEDGIFTLGEQMIVYERLKTAKKLCEDESKYLSMPREDSLLYDLLEKNLFYADSKKTSLEKKLESEGYKVSVEPCDNNNDRALSFIIQLGLQSLLWGSYFGGKAIYKRLRRKK